MEDNYAKIFILFICCLFFWNRFLLRWVHNIAVEKLQTWPLHIAIWPWWQQCCICDYAVDWPGWFEYCISFVVLVWSGGRGPSKALGRVLLEQRVEHQRCQREAINDLFQVENPYSEWAQTYIKWSLNISYQSSSPWSPWWRTAVRPASLGRLVSAAFANAALAAAATSAPAATPTLEKMPPCKAPAAKHLCWVLVREIFALCSQNVVLIS